MSDRQGGIAPKWKAHTMPCPEPGCDGDLRLRYSSKFDRHWYGCSMWPLTQCNGGIGCYRDGRPLGVPVDSKTKQCRIAAHDAFDRLWKGHDGEPPLMGRGAAYRWLASMFGQQEVHMGEMSAEECDRVVAVMHEHYPGLF